MSARRWTAPATGVPDETADSENRDQRLDRRSEGIDHTVEDRCDRHDHDGHRWPLAERLRR